MSNLNGQAVKTVEELKKQDEVKKSELAKLSGLRPPTIQYYSDIGLLNFTQDAPGLTRRYNRIESIKRIDEIKKYKRKRYTIDEIKTIILR